MKDQQDKDRILLVDDEENILVGYQRLLAPHYDVFIAGSGKDALEAIRSQPPFSVIVSDIKMPRMTGIELLEQVRLDSPDTIRIVLTGYADLDTAIQAVNKGAIFRFLTKPCKFEDMHEALKAGVNQHRMTFIEQELRTMTRMKEGFEKTLRSFIKLVEFRDPYTAGHMDRTALLARKIGDRLSIAKESRRALNMASLVHDVGKVAVPTSILNKPYGLTDAEFAIIRTHVEIGADVMNNLESLWPISRIIMEHHERIDGSGYPNGASGKDILPESRILSVADTMDALLTDRPYRRRLRKEATLELLYKLKGTQLDPDVVECGIELLRDGSLDSIEAYKAE